MFKDHDETHGMSISFTFSNSWANERVTFLFTIVRLVTQNVFLVILTTKLIVFKVNTGILYVIIFLLDHHNNVLFNFILACVSTQLNMKGRMCEQECIKCIISKMCMHLPTI